MTLYLLERMPRHLSHIALKNTIFNAKRLIGRTFDDPEVQHTKENVLFDIIDQKGHASIRINKDGIGESKCILPEDVSCEVLKKLKNAAELFLNREITKAVITIPAGFNMAQRDATKRAAQKAGLEVLELLNEPTAAAVCHGIVNEQRKESKVLVFDFGGGTLDTTILEIKEGLEFKELASDGDMYLGGEDYDIIIADYILDEFCKVNSLKRSILDDGPEINVARMEAAKAKERLTLVPRVAIMRKNFYNSKDLNVLLSRETFDKLTNKLTSRIMDPVKRVLASARLESYQIDDIVLVGGSSKLPVVKRILEDFFQKPLRFDAKMDESISHGAAIQAYWLIRNKNEGIVKRVNQASIGIQLLGDVFHLMVSRNCPLPANYTHSFRSSVDNQTSVEFPIYQGEQEIASNNKKLVDCIIKGFPPKPAGQTIFDVEMKIDTSNILQVRAVERETRIDTAVTISYR